MTCLTVCMTYLFVIMTTLLVIFIMVIVALTTILVNIRFLFIENLSKQLLSQTIFTKDCQCTEKNNFIAKIPHFLIENAGFFPLSNISF